MKSLLFAVCAVLLVTGCATKRYGRLQPVTGFESTAYTCREIELELSKVDAFEQQVKEQARFSGMSVASFLGDFGIGNVVERNAAERSAAERKQMLLGLQSAKCSRGVLVQAPAIQEQAAQADASALPPENGYVRPIMRAQQISTGMGCGQVSLAPTANGGSVFTAMCSSGDAILIDCRGLSCRPAMQGAVR